MKRILAMFSMSAVLLTGCEEQQKANPYDTGPSPKVEAPKTITYECPKGTTIGSQDYVAFFSRGIPSGFTITCQGDHGRIVKKEDHDHEHLAKDGTKYLSREKAIFTLKNG